MGMFPLSPIEVKEAIVECMKADLVPYIEGSPGIGKSDIVHQVADQYKLEMIDLRMSQLAPEDLMGLPMREGKKAIFAPFSMFPLEDTPLPSGKRGWLLFLDELPSASKAVLAASYKLILDRMVGNYKLHPCTVIVTAGNKMTDKAIATSLGTAMQSRLIHLEMSVKKEPTIEHFHKIGMDPRIIGFIEFQPSKLHHFDPNHHNATFACPRTWEFVSKLIRGKTFKQISLPLLAGAISDGVAVEFHTFLQEFDNLPSLQQVLDSPQTLPVPSEGSTKYAAVSMLMQNADHDNLANIAKYVKRFPSEFQVIFFRGLIQRDPTLKQTEAFKSNILDLTRFIYDTDSDEHGEAA